MDLIVVNGVGIPKECPSTHLQTSTKQPQILVLWSVESLTPNSRPFEITT